AMGVCLALAASLLLARALKRGMPRHWLAYGIATSACLYTHYYLVFAVAAQAVVVAAVCLRRPRQHAARTLGLAALAYTTAAALFVPWLPVLMRQAARVEHDFWIPRPTLEKVLRVPWALMLGGSDSEWTPISWLVAMAAMMAVVLAAA